MILDGVELPAHPAQVQRTAATELLELSDGDLGAMVVGLMSAGARAANFEALGRVVRRGGVEELETMMRRGRR